MAKIFKDELFQAQWLRTAGYASYGGAELGECFAIADQIQELDAASWYSAWATFAERLEQLAEQSSAAGHSESAKQAFLRASNYWRAAFIFLIGKPMDKRVKAAYRRQRASFEAAAQLMTPKAERISVPYEGHQLHGYLFKGSEDAYPHPTLIINGGYDSTAEESYFLSGAAAIARGYTCIVFDGPGQGAAIIEDGLVFRPDWEAVIRSVLDFAVKRPEVDQARIALMGISFGGYLAPRGASGESRLAALIADPGNLSLEDEFKTRLPAFVANRLSSRAPWIVWPLGWVLSRRLRHLTQGWALRRGLWVHGVAKPMDYIRLLKSYSSKEAARHIACPSLICRAEDDGIGVTARNLYDLIPAPKLFHVFKSKDGAGEHCEAGARELFNQFAFDWLDGVLGTKPSQEFV